LFISLLSASSELAFVEAGKRAPLSLTMDEFGDLNVLAAKPPRFTANLDFGLRIA